MGSAGDYPERFAARRYCGAVACDVAGLKPQPDQRPTRSFGLDLLQRVAADEVALAQLHGPSQSRLVGVDGLVHVVAPQAQRGFESGRVACAESSREDAGRPAVLEDRVPCRAHLVAADEQLEAVLARVAGARDERVDARHVAVAKTEVRNPVEVYSFAGQQLLRTRTLEGAEAELHGAVLYLDIDRRIISKPIQAFLAVA